MNYITWLEVINAMEVLYSWEKGIRRVGLQVAVLKVGLPGRETWEQRFE